MASFDEHRELISRPKDQGIAMKSVAGNRERTVLLSSPRCAGFPVALIIAASLATLWLLVGSPASAQPRDQFAELRNRMVDDEIVKEGIKNPAVIKAMRTVPRHRFVTAKVPPEIAYHDQALPIGQGQTISPPFIVAYMTESLDPQPSDRVLEIGTGSGYQAAVLAGLVQDVYTIEIVVPLGKNAARVLKELNYTNVHTKIGDGYKGWPDAAPFDKIIVTCSPENVPQPLIDQLKEGGKMIVPLGERYEQVFYMFEKQNGELVKKRLLPALFVPMTGEAEDNRQVKPDPKHPEIHNGGFEADNEGDGHPIAWHYQRQLTLETGDAPEGKHFVTFTNKDPGRSAQMLQAMIMDGRQVTAIQISLSVRGEKIRNGEGNDKAGFMIQYFDAERRPIPPEVIGFGEGTFDWKEMTRTLIVPPKAREAICRVGLNGATGQVSVDNIRVTAQPKAPAKPAAKTQTK
jgi:protein-L-isoaspartate(D-aspartate) O-methyltransferase